MSLTVSSYSSALTCSLGHILHSSCSVLYVANFAYMKLRLGALLLLLNFPVAANTLLCPDCLYNVVLLLLCVRLLSPLQLCWLWFGKICVPLAVVVYNLRVWMEPVANKERCIPEVFRITILPPCKQHQQGRWYTQMTACQQINSSVACNAAYWGVCSTCYLSVTCQEFLDLQLDWSDQIWHFTVTVRSWWLVSGTDCFIKCKHHHSLGHSTNPNPNLQCKQHHLALGKIWTPPDSQVQSLWTSVTTCPTL